jgi:F0F1-type ATP synthase assembly protein I
MGKEKEDNKAPWWQPSLVLFMKLSGWIAGPVLIGVFVGEWLDKKYGTEPWLFLTTVGFAFFISMFGIVRDSMRAIKEIEEREKKEKAEKK